MNTIKKVALLVVVISVAIGSVFGLLVQSSAAPSRNILFTATASYVPSGYTCAPVQSNYSEWLQIGVSGNRSLLNLNTVTVYDPNPSITLTMPLNSSSSAYVSYDPINYTYEKISIPLPDYWAPSVSLDVSLSYYFTGYTPTTYSVGLTPIYQSSSIDC